MNFNQISQCFFLPRFKSRCLKEQDQPAIFVLLQSCDDFSLLSSGMPSVEQDAFDLLHDCPPGIPHEQKAVIGFFEERSRLAAALDLVDGYPSKNIWFIGLLLVHPEFRGMGLGRHIMGSVQSAAEEEKVDALMLGVLECNTNALRFWHSLGFEEQERHGPRTYGLKQHMVIRMRKDL
jgi:ribosomal protein S18 acetylase RimI-like enzyme